MTTFEIFMSIATTGIFSSLLGLFYRFGRNQERIDNSFKAIDNSFKSIDERLLSIDTRLSNVEREVQILNTRIAVIESKQSDISTNITHLMWHHQTLPQKEVREE